MAALTIFLSICTPHLLISKKLLTICCCCQEKDKLAVVLPPLAEEVALTKNAALQVLQAWELEEETYRYMEEILHQLRLVVSPIIYRVLYIPGGAGLQLLGGGSRSEVAVGCWEPLVKSLIRFVASKLGKADKKEAKETAMALDLGVSNLAPSGDWYF